jgi:hypothetical protein
VSPDVHLVAEHQDLVQSSLWQDHSLSSQHTPGSAQKLILSHHSVPSRQPHQSAISTHWPEYGPGPASHFTSYLAQGQPPSAISAHESGSDEELAEGEVGEMGEAWIRAIMFPVFRNHSKP